MISHGREGERVLPVGIDDLTTRVRMGVGGRGGLTMDISPIKLSISAPIHSLSLALPQRRHFPLHTLFMSASGSSTCRLYNYI
jgi:hypothetical protein